MSAVTKKAIMQALVAGVLTDLMVKTNSDNVYIDDTTTLSSKLAEMITAINLRAKSTDVTTEIQTAISDLVDGAPETYNTLKEISDYISEHEEVVTALNAAIGNKLDKTDFESFKTGLGSLAYLNSIGTDQLDETLKAKLDANSESNHSHSNKTVLDGITSDLVTEWNSKGTVFVGTSQPSNLAAGDLFIKTVE